jgi:hypothetical protein
MGNIKQDFLSFASTYATAMEEIYEKKNSVVERKKQLKSANQMIIELKKIYKQAYIENKLSEIEELLFHDNKYVRCIAATYSLIYNYNLAYKVLNDLLILPVPNYVAPIARLSLASWEKGFLNPENI